VFMSVELLWDELLKSWLTILLLQIAKVCFIVPYNEQRTIFKRFESIKHCLKRSGNNPWKIYLENKSYKFKFV
jgi:hypothetical protein